MEKLDSEKTCDHIKCYALAGRSGAPWICEMCGEEGADNAQHAVVMGRYEQLRAKKMTGGFKER